MKRLVVCDSHDAGWIARARAVTRPDDEWVVLVLRVSSVQFGELHHDALAGLGACRILDLSDLSQAAARDAASFALDLVWRLPGVPVGRSTLGELLQQGDENLWWSLEISEKSPFRGRLIERLYQVALLERAFGNAAYQEVWLEIHDEALAHVIAAAATVPVVVHGAASRPGSVSSLRFAVRYWTRGAAAVCRFLAVRSVIAALRWPEVAPRHRAALGLFTIFPYWWILPFSERATDRFFSAPPADAHYVAWLMWPAQLWRNRRAVRRIPHAIVPLQRFVSLRDAASVLSPARFLTLWSAGRRIDAALRVKFGRFDVSTLVATEIQESMSDGELFFDRLVTKGLARYASSAGPAALAYRVEGQPWENALLAAAQRTNTHTVGFFHSPFGDNYPPLRFAKGEIAGSGHGAGPRPMPQGMLVCGDAIRRRLEADGYPARRIAECGPQRHAAFVQFLRERAGRRELRARLGLPQDVRVHYVALAIVEAETEGLFACLQRAMPSHDPFRLLIKTHPNRPLGDASMQAAARSIGMERIHLVPPGASMYDYLAASDTMICIGSTVAFEAMALGVMPVVYEHPGTFPATSLRDFEDALYVVSSPSSMRRALEEIAADAPGARARQARFSATVDAVFGDMTAPLDGRLSKALAELTGATGSRRETASI